MVLRFPLIRIISLSLLTGGLGGVLVAQVPSSSLPLPLSILLGALYGLIFAWLFTRQIVSVGSGLIWGLGSAFLLWLAVPTGLLPLLQEAARMGMLDEARTHFPELVAYLLCFGLPLGILNGALNAHKASRAPTPFPSLRHVAVR